MYSIKCRSAAILHQSASVVLHMHAMSAGRDNIGIPLSSMCSGVYDGTRVNSMRCMQMLAPPVIRWNVDSVHGTMCSCTTS